MFLAKVGPSWPFWSALVAILELAGGAELQVLQAGINHYDEKFHDYHVC